MCTTNNHHNLEHRPRSIVSTEHITTTITNGFLLCYFIQHWAAKGIDFLVSADKLMSGPGKDGRRFLIFLFDDIPFLSLAASLPQGMKDGVATSFSPPLPAVDEEFDSHFACR